MDGMRPKLWPCSRLRMSRIFCRSLLEEWGWRTTTPGTTLRMEFSMLSLPITWPCRGNLRELDSQARRAQCSDIKVTLAFGVLMLRGKLKSTCGDLFVMVWQWGLNYIDAGSNRVFLCGMRQGRNHLSQVLGMSTFVIVLAEAAFREGRQDGTPAVSYGLPECACKLAPWMVCEGG